MQFKRNQIWPAVFALLLPQPILAIESGANAMPAVEELERQTIAQWAYAELVDAVVGLRNTLEPLLPVPVSKFSLLDAEISQFIAEGQAEVSRLAEIISNLQELPEQEFTQADFDGPVTSQPESIVINGVTYVAQDKAPIEIGMTDEGRLLIDTKNSIDLPDVTIDPRNGGEYASEIATIQSVLDIIQEVQDSIPAPIQTAANKLYDNLTGNLGNDN